VIGLAAMLLSAAALYAAGVRRLGRRWPAARSIPFGAGLLAVGVALGPLDGPADRLLSAHMAQHMLLLVVAAPLLVLGSPLALALRALHGPWRRALRSLLAVPALAHPLTGWIVLAAVVVGTHLTPLYELALTHPAVHVLEHMLYLGAGVLFWRPLAGLDPVPHRPALTGRLLLLLTAMAPMALVGVAMLDAEHPWYAHYASRPGALADQHLAAVVMWLGGGIALGAATVAVGWSAVLREHRRQLRLEEAALR
jgi:cytochrome c oxidase assembly factor CtaG